MKMFMNDNLQEVNIMDQGEATVSLQVVMPVEPMSQASLRSLVWSPMWMVCPLETIWDWRNGRLSIRRTTPRLGLYQEYSMIEKEASLNIGKISRTGSPRLIVTRTRMTWRSKCSPLAMWSGLRLRGAGSGAQPKVEASPGTGRGCQGFKNINKNKNTL